VDAVVILIGAELALALLLGLSFIAMYWRSRWQDSPMGRHLMAFTAVTSAEALLLFLLLLRIPVSIGWFAALFGAVDLVLGQRIWLLVRARHQPPG
jgi:hypothetical protein